MAALAKRKMAAASKPAVQQTVRTASDLKRIELPDGIDRGTFESCLEVAVTYDQLEDKKVRVRGGGSLRATKRGHRLIVNRPTV